MLRSVKPVAQTLTRRTPRADGTERANTGEFGHAATGQGTEFKCGKFLVECCYQAGPGMGRIFTILGRVSGDFGCLKEASRNDHQATATSSCMFLTGAAQNYFVLKLAEDVAEPSILG